MITRNHITIIGLLGALVAIPLLVLAQTTDTTPPTIPANLTAAANSSSAIILSWSTSTDSGGVKGYKIYRATAPVTVTTQIATTTSNIGSYQDTGLTPATNYLYTVAAYDNAGNTSAKSAPVGAATQASSGGTGGTGTGGTGTGGTGGTGTGGTGTGGTGSGGTGNNLNLQRQGIFDCNQNGAYGMSVGAFGATGGVYVPVADATVELNTGTLVYKECVLREVVNREREAATAGLGKKAVTALQTGRNGNPQYVVNQGQELLTQVSDPAFLSFLQDGALKTLDPALQTPITRAMIRYYEGETRLPQATSLRCPYTKIGNLKAYQNGQVQFSIADFLAASSPQCDPVIALFLAQDIADAQIARCESYMRDQWNWGRGLYPKTDDAQDPCKAKTNTPASVVQASFQNIIDSPVRQLESANDIGQMINALYAGMTTQILSDNQGLAGLTQSIGGQPRYIDRVVQEAAQGLRDAATNVAIQNLQSAQQVEALYFQTVNAIGTALTTAIGQLRSAEKQCWELIIYQNDGKPERHACIGPLAADKTCTAYVDGCTTDPDTGKQTCPTGTVLQVSTSTAFSQSVITRSIAPLATTTVARINASKNALSLIARLIDGVTGSSLNAQRLAIVQLNSLVAQKLLHIQPDLDGPNGVIKQLDNVQTAILGSDGLVVKTVKDWADSTSIPPGWCNVNNPAVLDAWKKCWDKNNPNKSACPTP